MEKHNYWEKLQFLQRKKRIYWEKLEICNGKTYLQIQIFIDAQNTCRIIELLYISTNWMTSCPYAKPIKAYGSKL